MTISHIQGGLPFRYHKPTTLILDEGTVQACLGWAGGCEDGFTDRDLENLAFSLPITDPGFHTITFDNPFPSSAARLLMDQVERLRRWEKPGSSMMKMMKRLKQKRHSNNVIGTDAAGYLLGHDQGTTLDATTKKLLDDLLTERRENLRDSMVLDVAPKHMERGFWLSPDRDSTDFWVSAWQIVKTDWRILDFNNGYTAYWYGGIGFPGSRSRDIPRQSGDIAAGTLAIRRGLGKTIRIEKNRSQ